MYMLRNVIQRYIVLFCIAISLMLLWISSLFSWDDNPIMGLDKLCADACIILCCVILIRLMELQNTSGFQKEGFFKGLLYGSPFLVIGVGSVLVSNLGVDFSELQHISAVHSLLFTVNMLFVGMNEEIWMRGLILNALIRKYGESHKGIWKSLLISALIFGAIHIPNLFFMNLMTLFVQVVNAAAGGILFGAIYIKSKNLWAGITIHAIVDWCSLFIGNCFIGTGSIISMDMTLAQAFVIIALGSLPPILIALLLLKNKKQDSSIAANPT